MKFLLHTKLCGPFLFLYFLKELREGNDTTSTTWRFLESTAYLYSVYKGLTHMYCAGTIVRVLKI